MYIINLHSLNLNCIVRRDLSEEGYAHFIRVLSNPRSSGHSCNKHHHQGLSGSVLLDGMSQYHTIPHRCQSSAQRHFDRGKAYKAKPCCEGSKLYELNIWAMRLGRPRERTVAVAEELASKAAKTKWNSQGSAR